MISSRILTKWEFNDSISIRGTLPKHPPRKQNPPDSLSKQIIYIFNKNKLWSRQYFKIVLYNFVMMNSYITKHKKGIKGGKLYENNHIGHEDNG